MVGLHAKITVQKLTLANVKHPWSLSSGQIPHHRVKRLIQFLRQSIFLGFFGDRVRGGGGGGGDRGVGSVAGNAIVQCTTLHKY